MDLFQSSDATKESEEGSNFNHFIRNWLVAIESGDKTAIADRADESMGVHV